MIYLEEDTVCFHSERVRESCVDYKDKNFCALHSYQITQCKLHFGSIQLQLHGGLKIHYFHILHKIC